MRPRTFDSAADIPALVSVEEAAIYLGFSRGTVYQKTKRGEIPSVKVAGAVRIPGSYLRELTS